VINAQLQKNNRTINSIKEIYRLTALVINLCKKTQF